MNDDACNSAMERKAIAADISIAAAIVAHAQSLSKRSQALAERVNGKLSSVMIENPPTQSPPSETELIYPPFFSELRNNFRGIELALDSIENDIARTEL